MTSPDRALAGPVEQLNQLALHPSDPSRIVLRFEYAGDGLLYSSDGGESFTFMCGSMVSDPEQGVPPLQKLGPVGIAGDGSVLLGVFGGLWRDDGKGCSWTREEALVDRWVTDVIAHPSDPEISFVITSNGGDVENGIVRRNADGTYEEIGEKKAMLITRLRVAALPEGGLRFYESAVLGQVPVTNEAGQMTTKPNYAIRVSDDEGATWTEHELGPLDGTMRLEAVDPTNPDRIVISIARDLDGPMVAEDSVMVSENQGESFTEWTTVSEFGGITFSPEGAVWVGDNGHNAVPDAPRGIKHAASLLEEPESIVDSFPVRCLHYNGEELFVCQRFAFGTIPLDGGEFKQALQFTQLETLNECGSIDANAVCRQQLCMGYCKVGHFASAPMCVEEYDAEPDRGCAPLAPSGMAGTGVAPTGGTGGDAGGVAGAAGAGGADAGMATSGAGGEAGSDEGEEDDDSGSSSGGCSCSVPSARAERAPLALLGLGLLVTFARRRRKS